MDDWDYIRARRARSIITISYPHYFCVDSVSDEKINNFSDGKLKHKTYFEKCELTETIYISFIQSYVHYYHRENGSNSSLNKAKEANCISNIMQMLWYISSGVRDGRGRAALDHSSDHTREILITLRVFHTIF